MAEAVENSLDVSLLDSTQTANSEESTTSWMEKVVGNPMILKNILGHTKDLETARLVCTTWKLLATEVLQERNWISRKFIKFDSEEKIKRFLDTFPTNSNENLTFTCWKMVAWRRFAWNFKFDLDPNTYDSWMDLLRTHPHSIQALNLDWNFDYLLHLVEPIIRSQAESLVELKIYSNWIRLDATFRLNTPMTFSPVDFYLPCLKYFTHRENGSLGSLNVLESVLSRIPPRNRNGFVLHLECDQISKTIGMLQKYELVRSLKRLKSTGSIKREDLGIMRAAGVELESLIIYCGNHVQGESLTQATYEFLCHQKNTMKFLSWSDYNFKFPPWGIPGLTVLELTRISNRKDEDNQEQIQNPIFYSTMFPKLKELKLHSFMHQNLLDFQSKFLVSQLPCTTLEKLYLPFDGLNAQALTTISKMFPTIKSLKISICGLGGDDERNFYLALWNAEFKSTIEEFIITFYVSSPRGQYELHSLFIGVTEKEIEEDLSCDSGDSSIFNYTNLKKLEMLSFSVEKGYIGEASTLAIFGKIKTLEYLTVYKTICQFSPETVQKLKEILPGLTTVKNC